MIMTALTMAGLRLPVFADQVAETVGNANTFPFHDNDRSGTGITYDERTDRQCGEDPGNPLHDLGGPGGPVLSVPSISQEIRRTLRS